MWRPLTLFCICLGISSSLRAEQTFVVVQTARGDGLHLFAPVSVNRSKLKFWLVDTGAPRSLISSAEQRALELPYPAFSSGVSPSIYIGGRSDPIVYAESVLTGGFELGPGYFAVADLAEINNEQTKQARIAFEKGGLLGTDFLLRHGALLNCITQQIFFSTNGARLPVTIEGYVERGFTYIPLRITRKGYPEVAGTIKGKSYSFLVDTGAAITILKVAIRDQNHLPYEQTPTVTQMPFAGIKNAAVTITKLPDFTLGSANLSNLLVTFGETGRAAASLDFEHEYGGILGYDFLARYRAIIDLGNRALYLKIARK
ncbi:MAG: aspartyl protease family protein [Verrucomicrobia bacterium]|nr:aspartyl protease family protein [Verrucomicrobiota bacterium]